MSLDLCGARSDDDAASVAAELSRNSEKREDNFRIAG